MINHIILTLKHNGAEIDPRLKIGPRLKRLSG